MTNQELEDESLRLVDEPYDGWSRAEQLFNRTQQLAVSAEQCKRDPSGARSKPCTIQQVNHP